MNTILQVIVSKCYVGTNPELDQRSNKNDRNKTVVFEISLTVTTTGEKYMNPMR